MSLRLPENKHWIQISSYTYLWMIEHTNWSGSFQEKRIMLPALKKKKKNGREMFNMIATNCYNPDSWQRKKPAELYCPTAEMLHLQDNLQHSARSSCLFTCLRGMFSNRPEKFAVLCWVDSNGNQVSKQEIHHGTAVQHLCVLCEWLLLPV